MTCLNVFEQIDGQALQKRLGVVVSAMGGKPKVTDMLLDLVSLAAAGKVKEYTDLLSAIEKKHMDSITVSVLSR